MILELVAAIRLTRPLMAQITQNRGAGGSIILKDGSQEHSRTVLLLILRSARHLDLPARHVCELCSGISSDRPRPRVVRGVTTNVHASHAGLEPSRKV